MAEVVFEESLEAALNQLHEKGGISADELQILTEEIFEAEDAENDTEIGKIFSQYGDDPARFGQKVRMMFKRARSGGKAD